MQSKYDAATLETGRHPEDVNPVPGATAALHIGGVAAPNTLAVDERVRFGETFQRR